MVEKYTTITLRSDVADRLSEIAERNKRSNPKQIEWWIDEHLARASANARPATNQTRR